MKMTRSGEISREGNLPSIDPKRGEIWWIDPDPTRGAEMSGKHMAVVIGSDMIRRLPLRLVAMITSWQSTFDRSYWHIKLIRSHMNGLKHDSAVDCLQIRAIDTIRFSKKCGSLSASELESVVTTIASVIEYT